MQDIGSPVGQERREQSQRASPSRNMNTFMLAANSETRRTAVQKRDRSVDDVLDMRNLRALESQLNR